MREKLLENIQAGLNEAKQNMSIYPVSKIKWDNETLKDIAKHVEPFKQFSPEEIRVLKYALETVDRYLFEDMKDTHKALWEEIKDIPPYFG